MNTVRLIQSKVKKYIYEYSKTNTKQSKSKYICIYIYENSKTNTKLITVKSSEILISFKMWAKHKYKVTYNIPNTDKTVKLYNYMAPM